MKKHKLNILPLANQEDYASLKADIAANGYDKTMPIILYQGDILDGWNRYRACQELSIAPAYRDFTGTDQEALEYVIRTNKRRNLTSSQWAVIAVEAEEVVRAVREQAKEAQGQRNDITFGKKLPNVETAETVANMFNTNKQYVKDAMKIKEEAPELLEKVRSGEATIKQVKDELSGEARLNIFRSDNNEWYTPAIYVESARKVMGTIDLDPASNDMAQQIVKAATYYTKDTDGLSQKWSGKVWLNPPYGNLGAEFAQKVIEEYEAGNITEAILLLNSNSGETQWFSPLWNNTLCFTSGRINYMTPDGATNGSTHGSVFVYLGENYMKFAEEFKQYGNVVRRII